jgi:hypothetical protein
MKKLTAKQKKIISVAWKQVENFIKDWQRSPNEWYNERDIQVEIASRIRRIYKSKKCGWDKIWARYTKKFYGEKFLKKGITMNRVVCEPPSYHRYKRDQHEKYRPDIVVLDDIPHPEKPYEKHYSQKRNDPMLWVCEIKYRPPWRSARQGENKRDKEKLANLLRQSDGTKYACLLNIAYHVDDSCKSSYGNKPRVKGRMRIYNVTLPAEKR